MNYTLKLLASPYPPLYFTLKSFGYIWIVLIVDANISCVHLGEVYRFAVSDLNDKLRRRLALKLSHPSACATRLKCTVRSQCGPMDANTVLEVRFAPGFDDP